jgi:hypothetical protein
MAAALLLVLRHLACHVETPRCPPAVRLVGQAGSPRPGNLLLFQVLLTLLAPVIDVFAAYGLIIWIRCGSSDS